METSSSNLAETSNNDPHQRSSELSNQNNKLNQPSSSSPSPSSPPPTGRQSLLDLIQSQRSSPNENSSRSASRSLSRLVETLSGTRQKLLVCLPSDDQPDILENQLDPKIDGIPYFFILSSRLKSDQTIINHQILISQVERFCSSVTSDQLLALSQHLLGFVQTLIQWTNRSGQLNLSIRPIADLIKSYMPPEVLTPLHAPLMQSSLKSQSLEHALEISNNDILLVNKKGCPVTYQDHLAYHYLAGTIQALDKNYARAIHLLTIVVSAPGPSISQFQIDAYKKLILISLLFNSRPPVLPSYTHSLFRSVFKTIAGGKPYNELMTCYEHPEIQSYPYQRLCKIAEQNMARFEDDQNSGLVKMCLATLPRKMIKGLIPIYSSIPLSRLDSLLPSLPKGVGRELVEEMVRTGELEAEISSEDVRFLDERERMDCDRLTEEVRRSIKRAKNTARVMGSIAGEVERDKEYLIKVLSDLRDLERSFSDSLQPGTTGVGSSSSIGIINGGGGGGVVGGGGVEKNFGILEEDLAGDLSNSTWDDPSSFR